MHGGGVVFRAHVQQQVAREQGDEIIVGVNRYAEDEEFDIPLQRIDDDAVRDQINRVKAHKAHQGRDAVDGALGAVRRAAAGSDNLLPPMREALRSGATLGQIAGVLRLVFGEHRSAG